MIVWAGRGMKSEGEHIKAKLEGWQRAIRRSEMNGYDRNSIAIAYNFTFENYTLNYFQM